MTIHLPIPDHAVARQMMIDNQLRPQGVTDRAVLQAMKTVPREAFVPAAVRPLAYGDRSVPLGHERFLVAPAVLGQLLTRLEPVAGERALVVGAGTGYSAAILAEIGLDVTALETAPELVVQARENGVTVMDGDLTDGWEMAAPYQLVLIDGAVEQIPQKIIDQLADGGRLGAALIEDGVTRLIIGRKVGGAFGYISIGDAGVAALPGFARPRTFTF